MRDNSNNKINKQATIARKINCCAITSIKTFKPLKKLVTHQYSRDVERCFAVKSNETFVCILQVTKEELAKLVLGFDKQEILTSGGVTLAGQRYIYLSGTDRVIRAKSGKVGVHCMKTQQGKRLRMFFVACAINQNVFSSVNSCYRLHLRRTRSTSTSCNHSWETWRLFDYMWLLEVRRRALPASASDDNMQEKWNQLKKIICPPTQNNNHLKKI